MSNRLVLLLLPALVFAGVDLASSDYDAVRLAVSLPAPQVALTSANGASYAVITVPDAGISNEIGAPQLPVIRKLVEIPYGAEPTVVIRDVRTGTLTLTSPLLPVQPPQPKSGPTPAFAFDAKAYAERTLTPDVWARVQSVAQVRSHRIALLEIYPARHNPATGLVEYLTQADIVVELPGANPAETRRRQHDYYSPELANLLRGLVINPDAYEIDPPPALPVGYLVIVPDAMYNNVLPLARWRRQKGMTVTVAKLSQVGGGGSAQVLAYLQNAYNTWPVKPSYVLLVGDVDVINCFDGQGAGSPKTDLNYSCLEGSDYLPDIALSRASVTSPAQLDSLVQKTIKYERNEWLNGTDWCGKSYFLASADGSNHGVTERTHRYCIDRIRPRGVICDTAFLYYNDDIAPVLSAINGGRAWAIYSGHGSDDMWAETSPSFDVDYTHDLTNADKVPFVATFACLSGAYATNAECFSESWIRTGYRGAIAHMASSVTSYWTEDDTLQRRLFDCLYDSGYTWVMSAVNRAKIWYFAQMGNNSTTRRYFEMYNMMGDGGVDVYWATPAALTVTAPAVIPIGSYTLHVTVEQGGTPVRNALVCAAGAGDTTVHTVGYTDAAGVVDLPVNTSGPDSVYLTVTGHNLAPYLGAVLALPSSGPYIMKLRHSIDDPTPGGNADGIVNPGESVNLPLWVKNWGQGPGSGISATLRPLDPALTIIDSFHSFGAIPAGDSAFTGAPGYRFAVSDTVTNGHGLSFLLVCRDDRDTTWTSRFSITVGTGILNYTGKRVDDPGPGGNNNGKVDPGEDAFLFARLANTGLGHAYDVAGKLRSGDVRFRVTDSLATFGLVRRDSTRESTDPFGVTADAAILPETPIPCTLIITASGNYTRTVPFTLVIGEITTFDPIPDNAEPPIYWAYDDVDSGYTEHPDFNWVEIRGRGTRLTLSDDQTVTISLPPAFGPFKYYGQRYTQLSICSNGFIVPGSFSTAPYTNEALPTDAISAPAICAVWDDLYPPTGGGVWWFHDPANHALVVEYDSVSYYPSGSGYDKFEIIIQDTTLAAPDGMNKITVQYLTANGYSDNTAGIQNAAHTIGINCLTDGAYTRGVAPVTARSAIRYTSQIPASAVTEPEAGASSRLHLALRAFPNPSRGQTRISWQMPLTGNVSLKLYDISGKAVMTLAAGRYPAGSHSVTIRNPQSTIRISSGLYFARLEVDGTRVTEKLILAR